ncbi:MBL fold metallo-hydrolase [Variovorax sp. YR216]|uniref:MBL fold metallo-hydrolase n=1 Tax=Variovorax sp. YR216 TaxID=1882828 RepID=UPI000B82BD84|nr:MBL fold metallo-hydrolase [Variovorax sp. YR216]
MAIVAASVSGLASHSLAAPLNVTILGSGSPVPSNVRFSQSTLVEAGNDKFLFDLGRGVTVRLGQLGVPFKDITASFITHFHSDHLVGLPDLWLTGWLPTPFASRKQPMAVYGPKGTVAMTKNLTAAFAEDIRIRLADEKLPPAGIAFDAHDIAAGVVYERNGVRITAFPTHHGDLIEPNFGYTIEYQGKKVVISSDTTYDERIARRAQGADLLLHEVADIDPQLLKDYPRFKEITAHHTSPEEAGRIFAMAKPKVAAFTHIIVLKANQGLDVPATEVVSRTRSTYDGPLALGEDLMRFEIGDTVEVFNARKERIDVNAP